MKNFLKALAVGVLVLVCLAGYAQVGPTLITLGTNKVVAATTNTVAYSSSVDVVGTRTVSLFLSGRAAAATNATTAVWPVQVSPDDVTFYTPGASGYRIAMPMSGTSTSSVFATIDMSGARYFRLLPPENPSGSGDANSYSTNYFTNLAAAFFYK